MFKFLGWKDLWEKGIFPWHKDGINPKLEKYWSILLQAAGKSKPEECRFFVPLCGKTKDLLFLRSQGFQVIGCEGVHQACTDFFTEGGGWLEWKINYCFRITTMKLFYARTCHGV